MRTSPDMHVLPSRGPRGRSRSALVGVALLGGALLSGCTGSASSSPAAASSSSQSGSLSGAEAVQAAYEHVINEVLPSVVEIRNSQGLGSGVVYDDKGDIVTNAHVVGTDRQFQVLASGSAAPLKATLVGTFAPNDLAVVRVGQTQGVKLQPATFGDSSKVDEGEMVLAMGNPLGLAATVTNGIVSATGRTVTEPVSQDSPGATLPDVIQTSAAINPGNSGGALVDLQGRVIGIPTLAAVDSQQGGAAPGIGFAIPSNQVKRIADQLVASGTVTNSGRAALGVRVTTVVGQSGQPRGVGVVDVRSGGPAAAAGMRPGDIIVSVDGHDTPTTQALGAVLANLDPGKQVTVVVERGGSQQKLQVTLGQL